MANRKMDFNSFPQVPQVVHSAVLNAFDRLEDRPERAARPRGRSVSGMLRVAAAVICVFLMGVVVGVANGPAKPEYDFQMILDVTDSYIWTYDGATVEVRTLDQQRVSKFEVEGMQHIAAVGETLIGAAGQSIFQYDMEGNLLDSWVFDAEDYIWEIEADEEAFYLLACGEEYSQQETNLKGASLYRLDRISRDAECMNFTTNYASIELGQGGVYAYATRAMSDTYSSRMDVFEADGSMRTIESMPSLGEFAIDPSGEYVLVRGQAAETFTRILLETSGSVQAKTLEERDYGYTCLEANSTGVYIIGHGYKLGDYDVNEIICIPWAELLPGAEITEHLTIVNAFTTDRLAKAIEMFNERYPHIEVVRTENLRDHQLMADIMAGQGNADIMFTQINGGSDPQLMAKAGAAVNLAEYDEFMENYALWYDVSGLVSSGDYIYGVVGWPSIYSWTYNGTILNTVGIPLPQEDWTWDDFFEIGRKIAQYNQENNTNYKLLGENDTAPYLILQYHNNTMDLLGGTASYDNETFRSLISQWKEMVQLDLIGQKGACAFNVQQNTYASLREQKFIYPPVYSEDTRWPVNTITGVVNANCENVEAAVYFMTCFISPEAMTTGQFTSFGKLIADDSLYPEGSLEPSEYRHTPNAENAAYWQRMIENGVAELMYNDVLRTFVRELYPQYLNDEIDLDTMLRMLQQRADMMLGE